MTFKFNIDIIEFDNRGIVLNKGNNWGEIMTENDKNIREVGTKIARGMIEEEIYNSDPIYAKIDQWFKEGVSEDKIRERVRLYMEKKDNVNDS